MTGDIWIDLQLSLAEIEGEMSEIPDELPAYLPWVMQWAKRGLKGSDRRCTQPQPHVWPFGRCLVGGHEAGFPMQCSSRRMTTAAPVRVRP